ncbi:Vacuolar protein sorting-associated protein 70 [Tilletia horrida]|nr:Vacuolar protein sorting-associated protein 70 [Tilletia horrida]
MVAPVDVEKMAIARSQAAIERQALLMYSKERRELHQADDDDDGEMQQEEREGARRAARRARLLRSVLLAAYLGLMLWYFGLFPSSGHRHHHHHHHHHLHQHAHRLGKADDAAALLGYGAFVRDSAALSTKLSGSGNAASKLSTGRVKVNSYAKAVEAEFLKVPNPDSAREALRRYTAVTHIAGTEEDYKSAVQVASEWAELLGADFAEESHVFDAGSPESQHYIKGNWKGPFGSPFVKPRVFVDTYYTWINWPINSSLTLSPAPTEDDLNPAVKWTAKLKEDVLDEDPTSSHGEPEFHGYSASGAVTGPVVYANSGSKEDFARLHALGINTTGTIALVRYGDTFRGLKVRAAAEAGCVAAIIYSDPAEDGNVTEANGYKAYPEGPARNPSSVQRGSVMALSIFAGDPSTPGQPSYKNATRLEPEESDTLAKIPSIPLSYDEAKVLFESLKGNGAAPDTKSLGKGWSGAIPGVEYWTGPTKEVVHLESFQDLQVRKIWNGYAVIPGYIDDEVVVIGNHRDAWTFGAVDPNSGTAAFHEIVAGLGALVKRGWRPLRTIVVASWDAEEYGLVGSTEFGEDFSDWLSENAALYHNLDVSVAGPELQLGASPSVLDLYRNAAKEVPHPDEEKKNVTIDLAMALGSGSDFTVFLQHLGIASSTVGYGATADSPVYHYHSNYDSFAWMDKFGDPGFSRHVAISKLLGLVTLRSASDLFLPINVTAYAQELQKYLDEAADIVVKGPAALGGAVDFHPLQKAVDKVQRAARKWENDKHRAEKKLGHLFRHHGREQEHLARKEAKKKSGKPCGQLHKHHEAGSLGFFDKIKEVYRLVRSVNKRAQSFERGFISEEGLVGREWYKHLGVAPGRWLGYGATTFPGLVEALQLDAGKGAKLEARRLEKHLLKIAETLEGREGDEEEEDDD